MTALQTNLASIASVIAVIEKAQSGQLTEGTETSALVFITNIVLVLTKAMMGLSFTETATTVISVTKVSTFSTAQSALLVELGKTDLSLSQQRIMMIPFLPSGRPHQLHRHGVWRGQRGHGLLGEQLRPGGDGHQCRPL